MPEKKDSQVEEVEFDYSIENRGKTHLLVVEFPEACDEECFLITLKSYLIAQSDNLRRHYSKIHHN